MKKRVLSIILAAAVCASLAACGGSKPAAAPAGNSGSEDSTAAPAASAAAPAGETYNIQLAGSVAEEHPITQALYKFEALAEEKSGGRIQVDVYPNGQLGSNREFYEQCQAGNIQMAEAGALILANFTDKDKFMQLPGLFNSRESVQNFLASETSQQINKAIAEETGILPLVFFENGFFCMTNSKHEIKTLDDIKGLKIRTQENEILLEVYSKLGASPMPMAFTELFTAMQQGTIDGQVNPALIAQTQRYYEVQKYITDLNTIYDTSAISINYDFFKSLPEDLQQVVVDSANEALEYNLQLSAEGEAKAFDFLESQGMVVTRLSQEERQPFVDATAGVIDWFKEKNLIPELDTYLAAIEESNQKYLDGKLQPVTGKDK